MFRFSIEMPNQQGVLITVLAGLVLCLLLAALLMGKEKISTKGVVVSLIAAPVLGCLFSHLFYFLVRLEYFLTQGDFFLETLRFNRGVTFFAGLHVLYGGMCGVIVALLLSARISGNSFGKYADAFAPAGFLFVALMRLAEGYMGQGYGEFLPYEAEGFMRFPFAVMDLEYNEWAWALFALEMVYALIVFAVILTSKKRVPSGDRALLGVGMYAAAQIVFESMRRDNFLRWGFVRCSELFSAVALLIVLVMYLIRGRKTGFGLTKALSMVAFLAMAAICLLMEFAVDGKIAFLRFASPGLCYAVMAVACLIMLLILFLLRALSYKKPAELMEE